jgi:carbon-monoxide dehydrogenase small subunit
MTVVRLEVNGRTRIVSGPPRQHLADYLREELHLTGTHLGCEHGVCGACTVEIDGAPVRACVSFPAMLDGARIRTIEDFDDDVLMAELRAAFSAEHALQCGFCTPGMLIAACDVVRRAPGPDEKWIRREIGGNLCRCTGYVGIVKAIARVIAARGHADVVAARVTPAPARLPHFVAEVMAEPATILPRAEWAHSDDAGLGPGWSRIEESFFVASPAPAVWAALGDLPLIARCFPGASLTEYGADRLAGRIEARLGPIRAVFEGAATIARDDARLTGRISGGGHDHRSASRTRAQISYALSPSGQAGTIVHLDVAYRISGPLAQFSRGGIVRSLASAIISEFAERLNAALTGPDPAGDGKAASHLPRLAARMLRRMLTRWWSRL